MGFTGVVSISEVKDVKQNSILTFPCFYLYAILLYVKNQVASQGRAVKLLLFLASMVKALFSLGMVHVALTNILVE